MIAPAGNLEGDLGIDAAVPHVHRLEGRLVPIDGRPAAVRGIPAAIRHAGDAAPAGRDHAGRDPGQLPLRSRSPTKSPARRCGCTTATVRAAGMGRSAAHATNVFFKADDFRWTRGADLVGDYPAARRAVLRRRILRSAAAVRCRGSRASGTWSIVPAGSLDTEPGMEPMGHIFVESKASWETDLGRHPAVRRNAVAQIEAPHRDATQAIHARCTRSRCTCCPSSSRGAAGAPVGPACLAASLALAGMALRLAATRRAAAARRAAPAAAHDHLLALLGEGALVPRSTRRALRRSAECGHPRRAAHGPHGARGSRCRPGLTRIGDSPRILRYLWGEYAGRLPSQRTWFLEPTATALDLEGRFDRRLGNDVRVWVYAQRVAASRPHAAFLGPRGAGRSRPGSEAC